MRTNELLTEAKRRTKQGVVYRVNAGAQLDETNRAMILAKFFNNRILLIKRELEWVIL